MKIHDEIPTFELLAFSRTKNIENHAAAQVRAAFVNGVTVDLWMSRRHIRENLERFGESEGLRAVLRAYSKNKDFPPRADQHTANLMKISKDQNIIYVVAVSDQDAFWLINAIAEKVKLDDPSRSVEFIQDARRISSQREIAEAAKTFGVLIVRLHNAAAHLALPLGHLINYCPAV